MPDASPHHPLFLTLVWGLAAWLSSPAGAQSRVSPLDRRSLEGSTHTSYPLGRPNCRIQQLHADLGTTARTLRGHAYRRDAVTTRGRLAAFRVELQVEVSISTRTPRTASRRFADNAGARPTRVLPRRWIDFPATDRPPRAPAAAFAWRVPYATPFRYPAGGGVLCLDVVVYGNERAGRKQAAFVAYQDAHEQFLDRRNLQPGYRHGQGCPAPGSRTPAGASFLLTRHVGNLTLGVEARYGVPSKAGGLARSAVLFSYRTTKSPWVLRPACTLLVPLDASTALPGANDARGHWSGVLRSKGLLPDGLVFHVQVASVDPAGHTALSDASTLVVPPLGPAKLTIARVAHGTDRASPTGSVSHVVAVTEFF